MIAILGPGAVGGLLAALLHRAGQDVVLVGREATAARVAAGGVGVRSPRFGDLLAAVPALARLEDPPEVLLVAVKAPGLEPALARVPAGAGAVVPLLNGVEHLAVLAERFGPDAVVAGAVRVQAHREPGDDVVVVHRAPFLEVTVAEPGAPALEAPLRAAGVDVSRAPDAATLLWAKLTRLCALALATSAADASLGAVRGAAREVAREVAEVARAEGAAVDGEAVVAELDGLPDGASSSLRADLVAGAREHELDAIGGAVLRAAALHGLPAPRTAALHEAVVARYLPGR